ncbi:hypothetical protein EV356DRAFT_536190 [Viridothelium virens]|uniref:Prolyl 4-hydroxylase alpha subunit domain-containing protein n=1 Tax=Viridothelium virens TaxID=1048519 RepID=A0A6A6GY33_VIRVR|nr:hypothetical protein EV356DRAFT_536190 [Viridothelium virens]
MPAKTRRKGSQQDPKKSPKPSNSTYQPPPWPIFKPLVPWSDLSLNILAANQIVTISNFWTTSLCRTYTSFLSSLPLITTPGRPKKGEAVRVNDRFQIDDAAFATRLWQDTALKELVLGVDNSQELWGGEVLGLNPSIRIYRYSKGQFFDKHYDDSNNVTLPTPSPTQAKTTWTLLLYLTSPSTGCIGGETVFYPEHANGNDGSAIVIDLETGMLLLHRHGADCMLHEGKEVQQGEKWIIRSDLCVRR